MRKINAVTESLLFHDFADMQFERIAGAGLPTLQDCLREPQELRNAGETACNARPVKRLLDALKYFVLTLSPAHQTVIDRAAVQRAQLHRLKNDLFTSWKLLQPFRRNLIFV